MLADSFKDKLELLKESPSQLTFRCPICGGHSLKMNKQSNAYSCFSSGCSSNEIRKEVGIKSGGYYKEVTQKVVTPVYVTPDKIDLHKSNITSPSHKKFFYEKYNQEAVITSYYYTPTHKVDRVKLLSSKDKHFYPQVLSDNKWSFGSKDFPFLYADKLTEFNKTILFAEGEKCATEVSRFALCLTAPGFGSNSYKFLSSNIQKIAYSVKNILIFPDPDTIGMKKAKLLQQVCWEYYIPCSILKTFNNNDDIYDVIVKNKVNSFDKIERLIKELL